MHIIPPSKKDAAKINADNKNIAKLQGNSFITGAISSKAWQGSLAVNCTAQDSYFMRKYKAAVIRLDVF